MNKVELMANYILQLYFRCEKKYNCTGTKLEKLLSIAALTFMKNKKELFEDALVINACGIGLFKLPVKYTGALITDGESETNAKMDSSCLQNSLPEISLYISDEDEKLSAEEKKLLTDVFLNFGAYQSKVIGEKLNEFKDDISVLTKSYSRPIVDKARVENLFSNNDGTYCSNEIFSFIYKYKV